MYIVKTPVVTDLSGVSSTKFIVGSTFIGDLDRFAVTVISCATQVVAYRIQFSPFDAAADFATAGTMQTATNVAVGSGTIFGKTTLSFTDNVNGYLRIEASAGCSIADSPIRVAIHGMKRKF